jgi:hypothetical protein
MIDVFDKVSTFFFSNTSLNFWYWKGISCGHGSIFGEERM